MSEDFFSDVSTIQTKAAVLATNKLARMAYTSNAYANDDAVGVDVYSTNNEQNVPSIAAVDVNTTVIDRGLRSQAVSLPRNFINHFFGRTSYNVNKITDWFNTLLSSLVRFFAKNRNFYTDTTKYLLGDVCCMRVTESTCAMVKEFIRVTDNPVELSGVSPLDAEGVLSAHWALLPNTDTVTQAQGNNSTKIASTAYSDASASAALAAAKTYSDASASAALAAAKTYADASASAALAAAKTYADSLIPSIRNACIPVGFIYVQFPGMSTPATLWPFATWANTSSSWAGGFFRAEGGNASAFGAGVQGSANLSHTHPGSTGDQSVNHDHHQRMSGTSSGGYHTGSGGAGPSAAGYIPGGVTARTDNIIHTSAALTGHTHGVVINADGANEARPINYTVRIWKRTA